MSRIKEPEGAGQGSAETNDVRPRAVEAERPRGEPPRRPAVPGRPALSDGPRPRLDDGGGEGVRAARPRPRPVERHGFPDPVLPERGRRGRGVDERRAGRLAPRADGVPRRRGPDLQQGRALPRPLDGPDDDLLRQLLGRGRVRGRRSGAVRPGSLGLNASAGGVTQRSRLRIEVALKGIAFSVAFLGVAVRAQEDPHAACAAAPSYVPAELLERPLPLRKGIGNSRETVTTTSAEAQAFYDQGLNYLESYVWIEAARSFHQAIRLDPNLAMAYIGLSRVSSGLDDSTGAWRYFEKAKALAAGVTDRERRRIEIREKQLAAMADLEDSGKFLAYKKAIDDALTVDFEDPQLWLLRGNAEEANASGRGQRGTAASVAIYEKVLGLVPDHASAHHYLTHTFETIGLIEPALEHGEAFARLSPAIPHAAHMWGHDLRRVGRIDEAIAQFLKADSLERAYYESEKIDPGFDWHHGHNLDLLATCYEHKGQMKIAEKTMRESASFGAMDAYRAFNLRELPSFLIHRGRYEEALEAARALTRTAYPQSRTAG